MSQGTTSKTLGVAVLGAAMAATAAGTANAAPQEAAATGVVSETQDFSLQDRLMSLPVHMAYAAGHLSEDMAGSMQGGAERAAHEREADRLLGGLPILGPVLEGASGGGLPTESLIGSALPTGDFNSGTNSLGSLPTGNLGL
ncbi:hypothetical protein JJV70_20045 [Streptomyces sp. JJ66]|uniref:hypothetical protein n=1 Tax=Streptomyces sp. JJ66 TaxID=2803843 RepID=UPI001C5701C2|nr:hypothetical protein [Streptomyces sp. JJ66]MBW1604353.1 hypothetical protein [Streptomyces sp. JJ66]